MGAAPSREVAAHTLPRSPFYGQRQQIVLIPLLRDFFPSPDSALFQQLYDARCDPAVRYYHYVQEGASLNTTGCEASPGGCRASDGEGCGPTGEHEAAAAAATLTTAVGGVRVACSPPSVFPDAPCTREELYHLYITEGGERLVYNSDAEMLLAYESRSCEIRPLPCAVAFFYDPPEGPPSPDSSSPSSGELLPNGCVNVLGCYVKVTGFVGDISRLFHPRRAPSTATEPRSASEVGSPDPVDGFEMDLYLTKSAGDHNRTHVLLSAIYTYVEQWQRVCLRYAARCDGEAAATDPAPAPEGAAGARLSSDLLDITRLLAASTSAYYKHFMRSVPRPGQLPTLLQRTPSPTVAGAALCEPGATVPGMSSGAHGPTEPAAQAIRWVCPPLEAVRMRGRRTNVPLLCFLREVRAILLGVHAAAAAAGNGGGGDDGVYHSMTPSPGSGMALEVRRARAVRAGALADITMWLEDIKESDTAVAGATEALAKDGHERLVDTLLNVHVSAPVVQTLVEHVMQCLLHHLNPQEIVRAVEQQRQRQEAGPHQARERPEEAPPAGAPEQTPAADSEAGGEGASAGGAQPSPDHPQRVPTVNALDLRLPDEETIVESWPPAPVTMTAATSLNPSKDDVVDLAPLTALFPDTHLYWIVGPDRAGRLAATRALQRWHAAGNPVLVYHDVAEVAGPRPQPIGPTPEDLASAMASLALPAVTDTAVEALLDTGLALGLLPATGTTPSAVQLCRLPLEEALLGELSNACRRAREAGPTDPHWVRAEGQRAVSVAQQARQAERVRAQSQAAAVMGAAEGEGGYGLDGAEAAESAPRPAEAMDIVGDGAACLYRVVLASGAARVIAVTPFFLKVARRRAKRKNALKVRGGVHGTAMWVFYSAPEPEPAPPPVAPRAAAGPASQTPETSVTETGASPDEHREGVEEGESAGTTSASKRRRGKKAKRAAAAAAMAESTEAADVGEGPEPAAVPEGAESEGAAAAKPPSAPQTPEQHSTGAAATTASEEPALTSSTAATPPAAADRRESTASTAVATVPPAQGESKTPAGQGKTLTVAPPAPVDMDDEAYEPVRSLSRLEQSPPPPPLPQPQPQLQHQPHPHWPPDSLSSPPTIDPRPPPAYGSPPPPYPHPPQPPMHGGLFYSYSGGGPADGLAGPLPGAHPSSSFPVGYTGAGSYATAAAFPHSHRPWQGPPPPRSRSHGAHPPSSSPSPWVAGASSALASAAVRETGRGGGGEGRRVPPYGGASVPYGEPAPGVGLPPPPSYSSGHHGMAGGYPGVGSSGVSWVGGGGGASTPRTVVPPGLGHPQASGGAGAAVVAGVSQGGPPAAEAMAVAGGGTNASPAGGAGGGAAARDGAETDGTTSGSAGGFDRHVSFCTRDGSLGGPASPMSRHPTDGEGSSGAPPEMTCFPPVEPYPHTGLSLAWSQSTSQLVFSPESMTSPTVNDSSSRYPGSGTGRATHLEGSTTTPTTDHAVHVTVVRRRSYFPYHQRTGSFFSDTTTADGTTNASQSGGVGLLQERSSFSSYPSANHFPPPPPPPPPQELQQPPSSPHSEPLDRKPASKLLAQSLAHPRQPEMGLPPLSPLHSASFREDRSRASPTSPHHRRDVVGASRVGACACVGFPPHPAQQSVSVACGTLSSTGSGEAVAHPSVKQPLKSGRYRWDWRRISIDPVDED